DEPATVPAITEVGPDVTPFVVPPADRPAAASWLRTSGSFGLVLLAGYGIHLTWARRRFSSPGPVAKLMCLWSRPTKRPSETSGNTPPSTPSSHLVETQVVAIDAREPGDV